MSRIATGDRVTLTPSNNIYTVLAIIATLINLIGFVVIALAYTAVFGSKSTLFSP